MQWLFFMADVTANLYFFRDNKISAEFVNNDCYKKNIGRRSDSDWNRGQILMIRIDFTSFDYQIPGCADKRWYYILCNENVMAVVNKNRTQVKQWLVQRSRKTQRCNSFWTIYRSTWHLKLTDTRGIWEFFSKKFNQLNAD